MKTLRLLLIVIIAVLVFSVWVPAPAYASSPTPTTGAFQVVSFAKEKTGSLTVENRTGGTLYVRLTGGPKPYWFSAPKQGKTTFKNIAFGKYTITVTTSGCKGALTYTKNIKGEIKLKPFVCR